MRRQKQFNRADRIGLLMREEVERIVSYEVRSPLVNTVKVTRSELSGDLGHFKVYYAIGETTADHEEIQSVLERAAGFVARTLRDTLQLKRNPKVRFYFDHAYTRMERIDQLLTDDANSRSSDQHDP